LLGWFDFDFLILIEDVPASCRSLGLSECRLCMDLYWVCGSTHSNGILSVLARSDVYVPRSPGESSPGRQVGVYW